MLVVVLAAGGCSAGSDVEIQPAAPDGASTRTGSAPSDPPKRRDPADVVTAPRATVLGVQASRRPAGYRTLSVWRPPGRSGPLVLVRGDEHGSRQHRFITRRQSWSLLGHPLDVDPLGRRTARRCAEVAGGLDLCLDAPGSRTRVSVTADGGESFRVADLRLPRMLHDPVPSLARRTLAVVSGGDGATLFPFQRVSRSTDGGRTWTTTPLPRIGRARAYSAGQAVLPDGRLLALLPFFSDDRPGRPAARPHGLYVSSGDDWSRFTPLARQPGGRSRAGEPPELDGLDAVVRPRPVVWLQHGGDTMFVSTGDLRFAAVPLR